MLETLEEKSTLSFEDYWAIVKRRRWCFMLPFFLAWLLTWTVGRFVPPAYESDAVILVTRPSVPDGYVIPNVTMDLGERLQSMTPQILSQTRLERIIQDLNLYPEEKARLGPSQVVERMRKDIQIIPIPVDEIAQPSSSAEDPATAAKRALMPQNGKLPDATPFRISYLASTPFRAQQVTNQLVSLFIEENLRERQQKSETTTNFLTSQTEEAARNLQAHEAKLQEFKTRYFGELPEQRESNLQTLSSLENRLHAANEALNHAGQQKLYLENLASQYQPVLEDLRRGKLASSNAPSSLDKEIDQLKTQLAALKGSYTVLYPDVQRLKEQIAEDERLKKQQEADSAQKSGAGAGGGTGGDPAAGVHASSLSELQQLSPVLQIEGQVEANKREIADRQREIRGLQEQIARYQALLSHTLLREQQLADLTRNYEQLRSVYELVLAKTNQSALATNLEKRQQGEQFIILSTPTLPTKAAQPNPFTFSLIGLGAGAALGLLIAIVAELRDDRIHSEKELKEVVTAEILAGIPLLLTRLEIEARRRRPWLEAAVALVMICVMTAGSLFSFLHG